MNVVYFILYYFFYLVNLNFLIGVSPTAVCVSGPNDSASTVIRTSIIQQSKTGL